MLLLLYAFHMKILPIISSSNPLLKTIRLLHDRSGRTKTGLFLVEGTKPVEEAFAKGLSIKSVVVSQTYLKHAQARLSIDIDCLLVLEDKLFANLVTTTTPPGILAVAEIPKHTPEELFCSSKPLILIAEAIQDPGNMGTIIRSALASSASGIICTTGTVDPFNPKVVRSASGALFALPILFDLSFLEAVSLVKEHGLKLLACQPRALTSYWQTDLTGAIAIVMGNEGQGLSPEVQQVVDQDISIPMDTKSESLNVAVCASLILYEALRQRHTPGTQG